MHLQFSLQNVHGPLVSWTTQAAKRRVFQSGYEDPELIIAVLFKTLTTKLRHETIELVTQSCIKCLGPVLAEIGEVLNFEFDIAPLVRERRVLRG